MGEVQGETVLSDEELVAIIARHRESLRARDAALAAFQELRERYEKRVLTYLIRRVGEPDAEDISQGIWAGVWEAPPEPRQPGSFRAWLFQVAGSRAIDCCRKIRPAQIHNEDLLQAINVPVDQELIDAENRTILQRCIGALPASDAAIIRAICFDGESYEDLCRRLGLSKDKAQKAKHLAIKKLEKCAKRGQK